MKSPYPYIGYFPALPLEVNISLGGWTIGSPPEDVPWRSERFKELAQRFAQSFGPFKLGNGSWLWHNNHGFDGVFPGEDVVRWMQAAVCFSVLDVNDRVSDEYNRGRFIASTENTHLMLQPVDEDEERITYNVGGMLKATMSCGWKIGEGPVSIPDATQPIERPVRVSRKLAAAVFNKLCEKSDDSQRIETAIDWHSKAMMNSNVFTMQFRLIALKTGFEILLEESLSLPSAERLRNLFETVTKPYEDALPWRGILWSPEERKDLKRNIAEERNKPNWKTLSELQDWFMMLAKARNDVIHRGIVSFTDYPAPPERPLSWYKGSLCSTGERLLREAIKAKLGAEVLLCGRLTELAQWEPIVDRLRRDLLETGASEVDDAESEIEPSRTVDELLAKLNCTAANQVILEMALSGIGNSSEDARAVAQANQDKWMARSDEVALLISNDEKKLLMNAGAEEKPLDFVMPCD